MRFRTHMSFGFFLGLVFLLTDMPNKEIFVLGLLVGSPFPDLDIRSSWMSKQFPYLGWLFSSVLKHRGIFHSLIPVAIIGAVLYPLLPSLAAGFCFGFFLHLLLDSLTKQGVKWLYPFLHIRGRLRVGELEDNMMFIFFGVASCIIAVIAIM